MSRVELAQESGFEFQIIQASQVLSRQFGCLEFSAPKWAPFPRHSFPFYLDSLAEASGEHDEVVAWFIAGSRRRPAIARRGRALLFFFDPIALMRSHLEERCVSQTRPFFLNVPLVYDLTSPTVHFFLFRLVTSATRLLNRNLPHPYPDWPTDFSLMSLLKLLGRCGVDSSCLGVYTGPWPNGACSPVCLSHDVDDIDGYRNAPSGLH